MPRVYRTKKQYEGFLIREFLTSAGYRIRRAKWTESPDALVTISHGNRVFSVGIEHTDYFNDTVAGTGSPLSPISVFWEDVQSSLIRRIGQRRPLTGLDARVRLNERFLNGTMRSGRIALAKQLAKDLVAFAEANNLQVDEERDWRQDDFRGYPTLESAVTSVSVARYSKPLGCASRCDWTCSNISCGHVGLSLDYVASAVKAKGVKVRRYRLNPVQEIWLVISAGGGTISKYAGPIQLSGMLDDPQLLTDCQNSLFDRIVFWDRIHKWYKWLKPSKPAIQYED